MHARGILLGYSSDVSVFVMLDRLNIDSFCAPEPDSTHPPGASMSARFNTAGFMPASISLLLATKQSSSCTVTFMPTEGLYHASFACQRNFWDTGGAGIQSA